MTDEQLIALLRQAGFNVGGGARPDVWANELASEGEYDALDLFRALLSASRPAGQQRSGVEHFNYLCSLLPEGFHWSDPLTPDVLNHIVSAAAPAQSGETKPEEVIDYSIKRGDVVENDGWTLTTLIVEDVNWALRAVALRLGADGGLVVWPANGLRKVGGSL